MYSWIPTIWTSVIQIALKTKYFTNISVVLLISVTIYWFTGLFSSLWLVFNLNFKEITSFFSITWLSGSAPVPINPDNCSAFVLANSTLEIRVLLFGALYLTMWTVSKVLCIRYPVIAFIWHWVLLLT